MRALICSKLEGIDSLEIGELPAPDIRAGTVRIAVEASAVNFPDLLVIRGLYQQQPPLPFAPGMEVAGTITEVGEGVDDALIGDRAFAFVPHGGFSEQVVAPADVLFPVPEGMSAETAAALPIAYGTSYHALVDRAGLGQGESLLVLGAAGGVGLAAVQIGAALGARVIAAVSSNEKKRVVTEAGASEVVRYDRDPLRDELKRIAPGGVDVVFDPVGGDFTEIAFRSTAWKGRHLVIGFAAGSIPSLPVNLALLKGSSLVGVFWGRFVETEPEASRENMVTLTEWWRDGRIDPVVSETYPLERATDALRQIEARGAIGKLIVTP
jgi:NADPH:quinone reductase